MESPLTYEKYPFLKELHLEKDNLGGYAGGKWMAGGQWVSSMNPGTGKNIAKVKETSVEDYKVALKCM